MADDPSESDDHDNKTESADDPPATAAPAPAADAAPPADPQPSSPPSADDDFERREFLAKAVSIAVGGVIVAIPAGAGLATLLAPLGAEGQGGLKLRLAEVDELPADGTPKRYDVIAERTDAWTKYPKKGIGSVWLRKLPDGEVEALNASCPHLGCSVDFAAADRKFSCPCHASAFALDGGLMGDSVSPRGMDALDVDADKLAQGEVWVTFMNFKTKIKEKIPV